MTRKFKDKATHGKETVALYWQEVKKYKPSFFVMALCIPGASIFLDTVTPFLLAAAVGAITNSDPSLAYAYLGYAALAATMGVLLNLIGFQTGVRHESRVRTDLVHTAMEQLLAKDQTFFANQKIGALTGKFIDFINGHVALQDLIIIRTFTFAINVLLGTILIARQVPLLAVIVLALVIALLGQVKLSRILRMNLRDRRKELIAEANGLAADIITNHSTVKTFASESTEINSLDKVNDQYRAVNIKDFQLMSLEGSTRILVMQAAQILAIFLIIGMIARHQIQLGIAIFIIAYLQRLATQLFTLGELLFGYDKIMLQSAPMTEILMDPPHVIDRSTKKLNATHGAITFHAVTYSYQDAKQEHVLDDFNLSIPAGQKVGLVGHSGAGKTTVTRLLLRFDDIKAGEILIDNQNIANVTQHSLRAAISYVPQEPMLFHRSLRENIAYSKPRASETEIVNAIKRANAFDFISKLPNGLDTIVGERGVKLSGGQRQRVAIARALLKDAPILILDEATSALDSESEALIQQSLSTLMAGRTSIVVAHRLSTIAKLDRIIVLDGGKIVEDGTHTELIVYGGIYANLWKRQSGGFIDD